MTPSHSQSQTILLVEDSDDDYEATIRALHKANLRNPLHWSQSGQDALDFLRQTATQEINLPGLILLDLNMPGLDGRKTLQHIKEEQGWKLIPVIILTTSGDERDVTACYQLGANTYIQKPVTFEGLINAIRQLKEYWFEFALLPKSG